MDKDGNFSLLIKNIEKELRGLKEAHNVGASVIPYFYQFQSTSNNTLTITYGSGRQDIITQVFIDGDAILGPVDDGAQKLFISGQTSSTIWLVSTRPIINVE